MDQALSPAFAPFTFALALMVGIMGLELAATLLGLSFHGADAGIDTPELHAFDLTSDTTPDLQGLLAASADLDNAVEPDALPGRVPVMIRAATLLLSFGVTGFLLQSLAGPLPLLWAVPAAAIAALAFTRSFARHFARLIPSLETTATTAQFMGGLRGTVTQGIARHGAPAEVRVHDRHGNLHYLRCEPFRAADILPEGTEVLTLRERTGPGQWTLRILPLT